jgi:hypothetical protein
MDKDKSISLNFMFKSFAKDNNRNEMSDVRRIHILTSFYLNQMKKGGDYNAG